MLRMASRIAADGVWLMPAHQHNDEESQRVAEVADEILRIASAAPSVVADGVWEYVSRLAVDGILDPGHYPIPSPPLDEMVIEWSIQGGGPIKNGGVVISSCKAEDTPDPAPVGGVRMSAAYGIYEYNGRVFYDGYCFSWWCDANGEMIGHRESKSYFLKKFPIAVAMATLSFMNCKNVTRKDVTESVGPSAKWIRRQKVPTIRYHVLDITPMKEVLRTEGGIEQNGPKKAFHICRGHFARYENGLFGRGEACTVWRPSHVRGSIEHGIVDKDYRLTLN